MQRSTVCWFVMCGFGASISLLACGLATALLGTGPQLSSASTLDVTLATFDRYIQGRVPDVVLVGSSLTYLLKEEYFTTSRLRNLAIAGGSSVTGLEIVANRRDLPKLILVEANVLSRSIDTALVERYSGGQGTEPLFLRPVKAAVEAYEGWLHAGDAKRVAALSQLLEQPPSNFDNRIYAERALQQMEAEDPGPAVQMNAKRIGQLIFSIEQRGTQVLLFEPPYSEQIEGSRSARITRDIIHAEFPDAKRWLRIDLPIGDLRWADGLHLDQRSALIVARSIDRILVSLTNATAR